MKHLYILLFSQVLSFTLNASVLDSTLVIDKTENSVEAVLESINQLDYVYLSYKPDDIDLNRQVTFTTDTLALSDLLCQLFFETDVFYKQVQKQIILYKNTDQTVYPVYGIISDSDSQERLIGATLINTARANGVVTNSEGYYHLSLPAGYYNLQVACLGYKSIIKQVLISADTPLNFMLDPGISIAEVVIYGEEAISDHNSNMKLNLPSKKIRQLPLSFGENDVLKTIQFVPGVQAGMEGTSGIYVRGGDMGQNQILVDGIPIYHAGHMLGIFSLVNASSIQKATLVKGGFPAKNGGASSSYLNIHLKEGNKKKHTGEVGVGLLTLSALAEGPLSNSKGSYLVSARRTWLDLLEVPIVMAVQGSDYREYASYYFGDLQTKITREVNDKNKLVLNFFRTADKYKYVNKQKIEYDSTSSNDLHTFKWNSTATSVSWINRSSERQQINTSLIFHRYNFQENIDESETYYLEGQEKETSTAIQKQYGTTDLILKTDIELYIDNYIRLDYGAELNYSWFSPNVIGVVDYHLEQLYPVQAVNNPKTLTLATSAAYIDLNLKTDRGFSMNAGLRTGLVIADGKSYTSLQPRLFIRQMTGKKASVFAAFDRTVQYKQLLTTTRLTLPTDLWVPVTKNIRPQESNQLSVGYHINLKNKYRFTAESFYKQMMNCLEINPAELFNQNLNWDEKSIQGEGRSYGVEFLAEKTSGKFTAWFSYTYSRSFRKYENLNKGEEFPYTFDKPNTIQVAAIYRIKKNLTLSATWLFANGMRFSYPASTYEHLGSEFNEYRVGSDGNSLKYYEGRNEYQYPNYHRLDIGLEYEKFKKKTWRVWTFGVYNAYLRFNPYYLEDWDGVMYGSALLPTIPFIKYTVKY